ncbi:hypothetical protein FRX31_009565 [Thalictrum thalictroides]|uniref:PUM-HD domain-containing protein n=1 Tax=Thalictrum thalictroides TaxID=46969 RepID=A0A7J6WVZ4_THATH|nr:hypothetical protein FRX31_009565 [Thalictrum thalictroides]
MKDDVAKLSIQKDSSYVIEMCLDSSSMEIVFLELLKLTPGQLNLIAEDQFGNYVIQRAINVTTTSRKLILQIDLYNWSSSSSAFDVPVIGLDSGEIDVDE